MKILSLIQVIIQFGCIIILALMFSQLNLVGTSLIVLGSIIGVIAIWQMRKSKLSILPDVIKGATLIDSGIYSIIRHPMYLAVILAGIGLAINSNNYVSVLFLVILVIDLLFKSNREEQLLSDEFEQYESYKKRTKKIIPRFY